MIWTLIIKLIVSIYHLFQYVMNFFLLTYLWKITKNFNWILNLISVINMWINLISNFIELS